MVREVEAALDAGAFGLSSGLIYAPGIHAGGRRDRGAGPHGHPARGPVRDAHAQRGRRTVRIARGVDRHDPGGARRGRRRAAPAGLASQVRRPGGVGPGRGGHRGAGRGSRRGSGRGRGPVPVHRGRDDPRDDPPAEPARARRRGVRRRAERSRGPRPRPPPRWSAASPAGRTWPRTRAGQGSGSRSRRAIPDWAGTVAGRTRRGAWAPTRRISPWTPWSTTAWTCRSSSSAWTRPTSRRSWPCPGSRSARTPRAAGRATRSSTRAGRIRGRTGARPACSARTYASAARSRSRPRSPSSAACPRRDWACAIAASSARAPSPTSSSFDPRRSPTTATYEQPSRHPSGIEHVVVNGNVAVLAGHETGERAGRLLRRAG